MRKFLIIAGIVLAVVYFSKHPHQFHQLMVTLNDALGHKHGLRN